MKQTFSFIGAGNMASAIITGLKGNKICIYDKNAQAYNKFSDTDCMFATDIPSCVEFGSVVFLCVKPQNFNEILPILAECDLNGKIIVSIAAGITLLRIENYLPNTPVIRTIPNTPLLIGKGVTGICRNRYVNDKLFSEICRLFSCLGEIIVVREEEINAITAATSSAPAYVYLFIKAMADAGKELGITDPDLIKHICDTVIGSATLLRNSNKTPDELIQSVKSPNGTTERALNVFESNDFKGIVSKAMKECAERAKELSEQQ